MWGNQLWTGLGSSQPPPGADIWSTRGSSLAHLGGEGAVSLRLAGALWKPPGREQAMP